MHRSPFLQPIRDIVSAQPHHRSSMLSTLMSTSSSTNNGVSPTFASTVQFPRRITTMSMVVGMSPPIVHGGRRLADGTVGTSPTDKRQVATVARLSALCLTILAGKVADMSATRRRQAQMSPILAKKCMLGRHELVTNTRFSCRGFPTLVSTKNLRTR